MRAQTEAEAEEESKVLDEDLGIEEEPKQKKPSHHKQLTQSKSGNSKSKEEHEEVKKHKTYKKMMKRFLPS